MSSLSLNLSTVPAITANVPQMVSGQSLSGIDPTFDYIVSLMSPKNVRLTARQYTTFEEMRADYLATGFIYVNVEHSDATIFGSPSTNWQFRAWHDICHIKANADFSPRGEIEAAILQCGQIDALVGPTPQDKARWKALIQAEVRGQGEYYEKHGDFPKDQRAFVLEYLSMHFPPIYSQFPSNLDSVSVVY
jgi:hypothetical protein